MCVCTLVCLLILCAYGCAYMHVCTPVQRWGWGRIGPSFRVLFFPCVEKQLCNWKIVWLVWNVGNNYGLCG